MLAALLGALSLFAAAPAAAQINVWSATLTVADVIPGFITGCDNDTSGSGCDDATVLMDDEFNYGGTDYTIIFLAVSSGQLTITLASEQNWDLLGGLTLHVGSSTFALADAVESSSAPNERSWPNTGLTWTVGTPVQLKLTAEGYAVTLTADNLRPAEGSTVTVTATLNQGAPAGGAKFHFIKARGSALAGQDFTWSAEDRTHCQSNRPCNPIFTEDIEVDEGETMFTATLEVTDDGLAEPDETIEITVRGSLTMINDPRLTLTIPASGGRTDNTPTDTTTDTPTDRQPPTGSGPSPGGPSDPVPSGDATLSSLEISGALFNFDPGTDTYTVDVPYDVTSVTVTPMASDTEAGITVNGETVVSGEEISIDLDDEGETTIEIVVTAEDGTQKTYTVTVMSCPREDRKVLENFYKALGGDTWHEDRNWNSPNPLGQWFGVETEDGSVISLRLPNNGLSGDMPTKELLCLELKELALWDNDGLSGEVPQELVLAVERAALRAVAAALSLNTEWFESYENPYDFSGWDSGVSQDAEDRVTELDFRDTEEIEGMIPAVLLEQLGRLGTLYLNCTISVEGDAPAGVNVKEVCEEQEPEEPQKAGGGGCALITGSGDLPVFGLFLMALLVFAVLGRSRAR